MNSENQSEDNQKKDNQINPEVLNTVTNVAKIPFSFPGLFFALIGFFIFLGGLSPLSLHVRLLISGIHTTGTVVNTGSKGVDNPTVEFTTLDNRTIRYKSNISTDMQKSEQGQKVEIIYMASNPHDAVINDVYNLWVLPLIFVFMGGIFLAAGLYNLYKIWRTRSETAEQKTFDNKILRKDGSFVTFGLFTGVGLIFMIAGISVTVDQYQSFLADSAVAGGYGIGNFLSDSRSGPWPIIPFSLIFIGIGAYGLITKILRKKQNDVLKMTGKKFATTVSRIEYTNTRINKVSGRKIVSVYKENDFAVEFFSSPFYVRNLEDYIKKGDKLDVYVDPANSKKYFMDVENLSSA